MISGTVRLLFSAVAAALLVVGASAVGGSAANAAVPDAAATSTTIDLAPRYTYGESTVAQIAVADSDGRAVAGTVEVTVNGSPFGQQYSLVDGAIGIVLGASTDPFRELTPGDWTIGVTFLPADPAAVASSSAEATTTVVKATVTPRLLNTDQSVDLGATVTLDAVLEADLPGGPQEWVQFYGDDELLGAAPVRLGGIAEFRYEPAEAGVVSVTAVYPGDSNVERAVSTPITVTVVGGETVPAGPSDAQPGGTADAGSAGTSDTGSGYTGRLAETGFDGSTGGQLSALGLLLIGVGVGASALVSTAIRRRSEVV